MFASGVACGLPPGVPLLSPGPKAELATSPPVLPDPRGQPAQYQQPRGGAVCSTGSPRDLRVGVHRGEQSSLSRSNESHLNLILGGGALEEVTAVPRNPGIELYHLWWYRDNDDDDGDDDGPQGVGGP